VRERAGSLPIGIQPIQVSNNNPRVVICGAGVIGASIAYHLALRGVAATVVERAHIACAASGKSGGFLARDWCDGSPLAPLARLSYEMHAQLSRSIAADYGYREMSTLGVSAMAGDGLGADNDAAGSRWLDGQCAVYARLGSTATTAQVHPLLFTRALMDEAGKLGADLVTGRVEGLDIAGTPARVRAVRVDGALVPADAVVIAMGPWTDLARRWLPLPPVDGLKGFSITLEAARPIPAEALFVDYLDEHGARSNPEVFPRPDGEVYLCGLSDDQPLPEDPHQVSVSAHATAVLQRIAGTLSSSMAHAPVLAENACYRPICADALPVMGAVPGVSGAFVATGHNCWGILNAPASGAAMAELIVEGTSTCVDLRPFTPERFQSGHRKSK
jgi:glycine/D-amino acid oxidase-like deaminating enzyme